MKEIKEMQQTTEEVTVDTIEEVKQDIDKEPIEDPAKKELLKDIIELYGSCYKFSENQLKDNKVLRSKFEQLEKNLRKYRSVQEGALEKVRAKRDELKVKFDKAVKEFENQAIETLDPTKYDSDVAPIENEYLNTVAFCESKLKHIQGVKHITTKLFARDKSQIPSMIHAQSILMCIRILENVHEMMTKQNVTDFSGAEDYIKIGARILNSPALIGDITADTDIEKIVEYFLPISQHTVDKQASVSRDSRDVSFKIIDKVCEELKINVLEPTEEMPEEEARLLVKANQLKSLDTVLRGTKVKNSDGTFSELPNKDQKAMIIEAMKQASIFLSDVSALMSEEFINQLPFKHDGIAVTYKDAVDKVSKAIFGEECDPVFRRQAVAWILYSTSVIDKIPLLILYM